MTSSLFTYDLIRAEVAFDFPNSSELLIQNKRARQGHMSCLRTFPESGSFMGVGQSAGASKFDGQFMKSNSVTQEIVITWK